MSIQGEMLSFALPYLISFVVGALQDMVNTESLVDLRAKLKDILFDFAEKTETNIDDIAFELLIEKVFTVEHFSTWGVKITGLVREIILNSETKVDDKCLHLVDAIESIFD